MLQAGVVGPFVPFVVEYRMVVSFALYVGIRVLFGGKMSERELAVTPYVTRGGRAWQLWSDPSWWSDFRE